MKKIFIIIPSFKMTGPIKGAIALANSLSVEREVTVVTIKNISQGTLNIHRSVKVINLHEYSSNYFKKIILYKKILEKAGPKKNVASISMLFSADFVNIFCNKQSLTCSSVRGNLLKIYRMDYGIFGLPLAIIHLMSLRKFQKLVSMSKEMADQVKFFSGKESLIVGNFIDEKPIHKYKLIRSNAFFAERSFVFVGSISERKNPLLLLKTIHKLKQNGYKISLDLVGDGPLMSSVLDEIQRLSIKDCVKVHGHLDNPFDVIARSEFFVLPSYSEGTARASLEALYIGLPCIMRKIDGNSELIIDGENGFLFENDEDLYSCMINAMSFNSINKSLLPQFYSQEVSFNKYLSLVED